MNGIKSFSHIGIPSSDIDKSVKFYSSFGFEVVNTEAIVEKNLKVVFMSLGDFMLEIYQGEGVNPVCGSINHIALDVSDVLMLFEEMKRSGEYNIICGIEELPFWERGIRYFKIESEDGVVIEFCQRL